MIRQTVFALAVSLTACFHGGSNDYNVDNYWNELGVTHCQVMRECCTSAEYNDWWTTSDGNTVDCVNSHQAPFNAAQIRDAINGGTIVFDEDRARACIDALAFQECGDFQQAYRFRETYCANPLIGTARDGDSCLVDEECEGELCGEDGKCGTRIPEGAPCFVGVDECHAPFRCNNAEGGETFTCSLGLAAGATCANDDQCADGWCKADAVSGTDSCLRACDGV
ncbi:MAG: hypothetical protein H0V17_03570 [Deltaproteobacteria bacterium]|nr:hypothetical protein [Deltaproteobacteria bacterium]